VRPIEWQRTGASFAEEANVALESELPAESAM
jgi:hypothetical protein